MSIQALAGEIKTGFTGKDDFEYRDTSISKATFSEVLKLSNFLCRERKQDFSIEVSAATVKISNETATEEIEPLATW